MVRIGQPTAWSEQLNRHRRRTAIATGADTFAMAMIVRWLLLFSAGADGLQHCRIRATMTFDCEFAVSQSFDDIVGRDGSRPRQNLRELVEQSSSTPSLSTSEFDTTCWLFTTLQTHWYNVHLVQNVVDLLCWGCNCDISYICHFTRQLKVLFCVCYLFFSRRFRYTPSKYDNVICRVTLQHDRPCGENKTKQTSWKNAAKSIMLLRESVILL